MTLERFVAEVMNDEDKNNLASNIIVGSKRKLSFNSYVKKFNKKLIKDGRGHLIPYMLDNYYKQLYNKSGFAKTKITIKESKATTIADNFSKIKEIKVIRKGKTYKRTIRPKWDSRAIVLKKASELKPKSKEYKDYVNRIVESTGRSRQAVVKKIQRTRQKLKKGGNK